MVGCEPTQICGAHDSFVHCYGIQTNTILRIGVIIAGIGICAAKDDARTVVIGSPRFVIQGFSDGTTDVVARPIIQCCGRIKVVEVRTGAARNAQFDIDSNASK